MLKKTLGKIFGGVFNSVTINGEKVDGDLIGGKSVNIQVGGCGNVQINGTNIYYTDDKVIIINLVGDCDSIDTGSGNITVQGKVNWIETGSGDVDVHGDVAGDISTGSGDVTAKQILGSVKTGSGDISCR